MSYVYLYDKRTKPNSIVWFNVKEEEKVETIKKLLDEKNIVYGYSKYKDFSFTYDRQFLSKNHELIKKIHEIKEKELTTDE
jgi:uncharacterized protein (DUF608 family)